MAEAESFRTIADPAGKDVGGTPYSGEQMSVATAHQVQHHAPPQSFIRKHVFSVDHKVIGKQYYALALVAVLVGMVLSWLMRIHLVWPTAPIPGLQWLSKTGAP